MPRAVISLPQLRGSGTSGHVNTSLVKPQDHAGQPSDQTRVNLSHGTDIEIVSHERARKIEGQLYDLRLQLEARGMPEEDVEARIEEERKKLHRDKASPNQSNFNGVVHTPASSYNPIDDLDY